MNRINIWAQVTQNYRMFKHLCPQCHRPRDTRSKLCRTCFIGNLPETRQCTCCKLLKPLVDFRIRTRRTPKPRSQCKTCEAMAQRQRAKRPENRKRKKLVQLQWEQKNPERHKRNLLRRAFRRYGCPEEQLNQWIQRYLDAVFCDICGLKPNNGRWRSLHIDHCHQTGIIRGFLCDNCNLGLGKFKDRPDLLLAAANYLNSLGHHKSGPSRCQ